jgi:hypothetical protein
METSASRNGDGICDEALNSKGLARDGVNWCSSTCAETAMTLTNLQNNGETHRASRSTYVQPLLDCFEVRQPAPVLWLAGGVKEGMEKEVERGR